MVREDLLFALDIGTRTVIGLVLQPTAEGLKIIASEVIEHENRAMLDGQIHNVREVAQAVQQIKSKLEEKTGQKLTKVAVAAAGRALQTTKHSHFIEFSSKREVTVEDVNTLELATIQEAQKSLAQQEQYEPSDYHFVGYSVIAYRLDEMHLGSLIGQIGKRIELDMITTFLPQIVVDSLITVLNYADLTVQHMTLEPIAASNVVIPKEMYNFNLALIDIGAGTSDIAITKGGAIIAYAMVPIAGDEITEALAENYLLDYTAGEKLKRSLNTSEKIVVKDIFGSTQEIAVKEVMAILEKPVSDLAHLISQEILNLNQKSPQAVLCIGGGSLTPLLMNKLAEFLDLPTNRVGIKQANDIKGIIGEISGLASTQTITPIGIAMTSWQNTNQTTFCEVKLNNQRTTIFSLGKITVADALLAANLPIQKLHGRPGLALTCKVDGQLRTIKGTMGEPGILEVNGEPAQLDTLIKEGDEISYHPGKDGQSGFGLIEDLVKFRTPQQITLNGTTTRVVTQVLMNNQLVQPKTPIEDRAEIKTLTANSYREALMQLLEVPASDLITREITFFLNNQQLTFNLGKYDIKINGRYLDLDLPVATGADIIVQPLDKQILTIKELTDRLSYNFELNISFNDRQLSIPTNHWEISKNGHPVTIDTEVTDGDQIICRPKPLSFNQILKYINYQIPNILNERILMTINGQKANYTDLVKDGDKLELKIG